MWMYEVTPDREADPSIKHWAVTEAGGGGACPVQYWGTLVNGWKFYFRFRSNYARLNVAPPETPMKEVPVYNPAWSAQDCSTAIDAGQEYTVPVFLWPEGKIDEVYPHDPLAGYFRTEEDLQKTFAACFEQVQGEIGLG